MTDVQVVDAGEETPVEPGALDRIADEMEVARYQRPPIFPSADEFGFIMHMAETLSKGNLVPSACRGKPADVAIVLLGARDLGIPLTQAFTKLHVIDGKLSISAELMVALALQAGHRVWCEELNGQQATACAQRHGSEYVARFTFTWEDATTAGLVGKDNWKHYPKAMLWARAVSGVVRMHLPDVTAGITYTPEEVGDDEHFTAHPASSLDQAIKEEFAERANALPPDKQQALKADFKTWGLNAISRLTVEEEPTLRALLDKHEAIDVPSAPSGTPGSPPGGENPPAPTEASTEAHSEPELPPDAESVQHDANVDGPAVSNGDSGHCSACGAPIWYAVGERDGGPGWLHAEGEADNKLCPVGDGGHSTLEPAGPGIDVDALYAATHPPSEPDPKIRELQIKTDVGKMKHADVLLALGTDNLPVDGSPRTLKQRLIDHRLAQ